MILVVLVLVLILVVLVLVLILVLILVLVVLAATTAAVLLVLKHQLGVNVILLCVQVIGTAKERLLEGFDGCGIVLLLEGDVSGVVENVGSRVDRLAQLLRGRVRPGGDIGGAARRRLHGLAGIFEPFLPVKVIGKIVRSGHGRRILDNGFAIVYLRSLVVSLAELAVAGAHVAAVRLAEGRGGQQQQRRAAYD